MELGQIICILAWNKTEFQVFGNRDQFELQKKIEIPLSLFHLNEEIKQKNTNQYKFYCDFPALDFLIHKIIAKKFQNLFLSFIM